MTGWEFALIVLNVISFSSLFVTLIMIGKFFCVSICEDIYDAWENEMSGWVLVFSTMSSAVLIPAWIGYLKDIEILLVFTLVFSAIFWIIYAIFIVVVTIKEVIVPGMSELHYKIKRRKRQ